jgi:predicted outer membrane lipoprotein
MSSAPMQAPTAGGAMMGPIVLNEVKTMSGYFLLLALILLCVYASRVPKSTLALFKSPIYQSLGLFFIVLITLYFGWVHGIIAALAFSLLISNAMRQEKSTEGLTDFIPLDGDALIIEDTENTIVPRKHRWFVEKVLGENPVLIHEKEVKTNAVQDMSERSMGSSSVSK